MVAVKGSVRPGEILEVTVEKGVYRGLGLARHQGQVIFVPHTIPGETVRARVERVGRGYSNARLLEVLQPAAARRTPPCPYAPRCGGCAHQEVDYAAQRDLKTAVLHDALGRAGVRWDAPIELRASPETGWRTRAQFHFAPGPQGLRLGLYEEGSHRVVDVEACLQVSDAMNRTARALRTAIQAKPRWAGLVRGLELAESGDGARRVAALQVAGDVGAAADLAGVAGDVPWLTGLGLVSETSAYVSLQGEPFVETTVGGIGLRSHVRSFFQGNRYLVEPLARAVAAALPPGGVVLDLYSGVGLFSLLAAREADEVRAAELSRHAVEDARFNADRAGLGNVRVEVRDVLAALAAWPVAGDERIILDPPRTGAGGQVVDAIAARRPGTVVYVSCDPPTLGRDLQTFARHGYTVASVEAFDLFPDTFHVETLAVLKI